jgi:hypothetical protein
MDSSDVARANQARITGAVMVWGCAVFTPTS